MKVRLQWLGKKAEGKTTATFGVPWDRGILKDEKSLQLVDSNGYSVEQQTRVLAYWEDGSRKWSCHTISVESPAEYYELQMEEQEKNSKRKGKIKGSSEKKLAIHTDGEIFIDTGVLKARISREQILQDVYIKDRMLCKGAELISIRETRSSDAEETVVRRQSCESSITEVTLEQNHSVYAVVKVTGRHGEWIPFTLRLYFYKDSAKVRGVYTVFYDGNPDKDIIAGIGIKYVQCIEGELYNRHVRLSGDTGYLTESPVMLATARTKGKYEKMLSEQLDGKNIVFTEEDRDFAELLEDLAVWDRYRLYQDSATHYGIRKRTNSSSSWVKCKDGYKSGGFVYLGGRYGGIASGIRNFWQKYPSAIDLNHIAGKEAEVTLWFWSPYGEPMDMRHYDTVTHMNSSYEGYDEMRATPYGVANTEEFTLYFCEETPEHEMLKQMEHKLAHPDRLVCTPEYYSKARAFGLWQTAGMDTETGRWFEGKSEEMLHIFKEQIETNQWYGFWNYGDIMRFYDNVRHSWKYDLGGCAWNNSELVPDMWMWYSFLHSGSSLAFEMAEAYTRHGSEVDQYHFGPYKGLGSRHNVVHWGCGCKEPRVSMAGLNRFYYYLTGDERMGEILDETADADVATLTLDPLRAIIDKDNYPTHARSAPDWAAYCSNWMTKWERYQNTACRDRILKGINSLAGMPYRLLSGPMFGYSPVTGELFHIGDANQSYHMCNCFGALPVWLELSYMLRLEMFDSMLEEYGAFYLLTTEEKSQIYPELARELWAMPEMAIPVIAYAAGRKKDRELAVRVWKLAVSFLVKPVKPVQIDGLRVAAPVKEVRGIDSEAGDIYMNLYLAFPYLCEMLSEEEMWRELKKGLKEEKEAWM